MGDSSITRVQFFHFGAEEIPESRLSSIESTEKFVSVKKKIAAQVRGVSWRAAFSDIIGRAKDLLDIDVKDILVGALKKHGELSKYADTEKYPPGETFPIPLLEHTIVSRHTPHIEVLINGKEAGRIQFEIDLALKLEGAILKIDGGKIIGLSTGTCEGKGTTKCEGLVLLERETQPFTLPGTLTFDPPVPLA